MNKKLSELLSFGEKSLRDCSVENPSLESELLMSSIKKMKRYDMLLSYDLTISVSEERRYRKYIDKRKKRIPLSYITGESSFMGCKLKVNENTLIPRPETEELVDMVIKEGKNFKKPVLILDIGSGSGNIPIAISKQLDCRIISVDISPEALEVAEENSVKHGMEKKIKFVKSNIFSGLKKNKIKFDMVVSNPPYVRKADFANLEPELSYEPKSALDGGEDGLNVVRGIINGICNHINDKGTLFLELAPELVDKVRMLIKSCYRNSKIDILNDINDKERFIRAKI